MGGHALRIARNNTVRADAKSESLGFSFLEVVSLAPLFIFLAITESWILNWKEF